MLPEEPEENPIEHHRHVFPVIRHLHNTHTIEEDFSDFSLQFTKDLNSADLKFKKDYQKVIIK